jgi:hypothetical protein
MQRDRATAMTTATKTKSKNEQQEQETEQETTTTRANDKNNDRKERNCWYGTFERGLSGCILIHPDSSFSSIVPSRSWRVELEQT